MLRRLYNFFLQPYTNIFYCLVYHFKWQTNASIKMIAIAAVKDAWRYSNHDYLFGSER